MPKEPAPTTTLTRAMRARFGPSDAHRVAACPGSAAVTLTARQSTPTKAPK